MQLQQMKLEHKVLPLQEVLYLVGMVLIPSMVVEHVLAAKIKDKSLITKCDNYYRAFINSTRFNRNMNQKKDSSKINGLSIT